ncbi:M67 family metallopeptidase [Brevibacillus composti]|uniref:M67 family metallopeptidase n=1 Tax=Brevibacillus composti TaxID=2796470 RepID=A0A7T5EMD5_9BACL|nr:M67 family metallopeptidase [Brevibacillus composti]QQE75247.1 M67 family metallopeptidase [Brevibacillus composti]QUO42274.1 M67 family metallopeptidase [Brevibacillus composti]
MYPGLLGEPFGFKHTKTCLDGKVAIRLLAEAKEAFPMEYSALLTGREATITGHFPLPSATPSSVAFSWDGPVFLRALRAIQSEGQQWLGVLHSHPTAPPLPSLADREGWHYPQLGYWILGPVQTDPQLKLYQWTEGRFVERPFQLLGHHSSGSAIRS